MVIRLAARSRLRCAYCHADAFGAVACPGCRTLVHSACRSEVGRCPTLGCAHRPVALTTPTRSTIVGWCIELAVIAAVVLAVLVASVKEFKSVDYDQRIDPGHRIRTLITDEIR